MKKIRPNTEIRCEKLLNLAQIFPLPGQKSNRTGLRPIAPAPPMGVPAQREPCPEADGRREGRVRSLHGGPEMVPGGVEPDGVPLRRLGGHGLQPPGRHPPVREKGVNRSHARPRDVPVESGGKTGPNSSGEELRGGLAGGGRSQLRTLLRRIPCSRGKMRGIFEASAWLSLTQKANSPQIQEGFEREAEETNREIPLGYMFPRGTARRVRRSRSASRTRPRTSAPRPKDSPPRTACHRAETPSAGCPPPFPPGG